MNSSSSLPAYDHLHCLQVFSEIYPTGAGPVALSQDAAYLAVNRAGDSTITIWDLQAGRVVTTITGPKGRVKTLALSPDKQLAASGAQDGRLRVWNIRTGRRVKTFSGHTSSISAVTISPDGRHLVSSAWDKTIKIWSLETRTVVHTLGFSGGAFVLMHPQGRTFVSGYSTVTPDHDCLEMMALWDIQTGRSLWSWEDHDHFCLVCPTLSPDGRLVIAGSFGPYLRLWDAQTGRRASSIPNLQIGNPGALLFSPDGRHLIVAEKADPFVKPDREYAIHILNLERGETVGLFPAHTDSIIRLGLSPDGARLVSVSRDGTVKVWGAA